MNNTNKREVKTVVKRAIVMAISVILALAVAAPIASGQTASQRQDVKALTEAWWTWALTKPSPMEVIIKVGKSVKENL